MPLRPAIAAAVLIGLGAGPAWAIQAPPAPPPAPAPVIGSETDLQVQGEAFSAQMEAMSLEIEAAVQAAGPDHDKALADVDVILERYRPHADAFAAAFAAFFDGRIFEAEDDEERQRFIEARAAVVPAIRAIPDQVRAGVAAGLDGAEADPVAPDAGLAARPGAERP